MLWMYWRKTILSEVNNAFESHLENCQEWWKFNSFHNLISQINCHHKSVSLIISPRNYRFLLEISFIFVISWGQGLLNLFTYCQSVSSLKFSCTWSHCFLLDIFFLKLPQFFYWVLTCCFLIVYLDIVWRGELT